MNLLIVGSDAQRQEAQAKFGNDHEYMLGTSRMEAEKLLEKCEVVFDFTIREEPSRVNLYKEYAKLVVFLNTSYISLSQLNRERLSIAIFGFCGMPTFLNRKMLEVSVSNEEDISKLREACAKLSTEYCLVADRVGLVTPRVICMIINEAYYTVQEGTATREDIDLAMKLGTNYPLGPFEWCERIGSKNVCALLEAVYKNTGDERYKICQLLMAASNS